MLETNSHKASKIGLSLAPIVFIIMLLIPAPEGMSVEAWRVAAVTVLIAIWWITEAIPIPITALIPIILYPILDIMPTSAVTSSYANSTIYLFIGGFFIAVAMERWGLHRRIALHTIKLVGASPSKMTLGFMIATAFISMWVSNTATAMMMVPIGLAVIVQISGHDTHGVLASDASKEESNFAKGLMLAIAYSASIGGVATIIGTPPNTIMVGMMRSMYGVDITFSQWMMFGLPLSIVMLVIIWFLVTRVLFRTGSLKLAGGEYVIKHELEKLGKITSQEFKVLLVFIFVAVSWIASGFIDIKGVDDTTIAMMGTLLLFLIPSDTKRWEFILDWKTAVKIPWDIVLLFGGGFAIANGFNKSGLAKWISSQLSGLEGLSMIILIAIVVALVVFLTEVTSNTATATLLVPIMGSTAIALGINPYATIISACVAASFAFMLPVATPPNAVVFASGAIRIKDMMKAGLWLNIVSIIVITVFVAYVLPIVWGVDLHILPAWAK